MPRRAVPCHAMPINKVVTVSESQNQIHNNSTNFPITLTTPLDWLLSSSFVGHKKYINQRKNTHITFLSAFLFVQVSSKGKGMS